MQFVERQSVGPADIDEYRFEYVNLDVRRAHDVDGPGHHDHHGKGDDDHADPGQDDNDYSRPGDDYDDAGGQQ